MNCTHSLLGVGKFFTAEEAKLKQGETVFHNKNNLLALKWMGKREVYILNGLHKVTNVISKKTNYKGQKVTKPSISLLVQ